MKNQNHSDMEKHPFHDRLTNLQAGLRDRGWDALWVSKAANRRYLTGFTGSAGWLALPVRGKPVLITDGRYTQQSRQETRGITILISQKDPMGILAELLHSWKTKKLGFEEDDISVAGWKKLKRVLAGVKGRDVSGWVERLRAIKESGEIECIQKALAMAEQAYQKTLFKVKPGKTELELAAELEKAMLASGSTSKAFSTIMASGPNSALPHASPGERRLKAGDLLLIDFGCTYKGYHCDLTRTLAVSKATSKQKELYRIVKHAQISAQSVMLTGHKAKQADGQARQIFRQHRMEKHFVHSLGHGLGLEIHEGPRVSSISQDIFQAGMVVTCEPGLYFPDWGGIRIEDEVEIATDANRWLSSSAEELPIIRTKK